MCLEIEECRISAVPDLLSSFFATRAVFFLHGMDPRVRHEHYRFVNIELRIVRTGTSTVDDHAGFQLLLCGGWGPPWLDGPGVAYVGRRIGGAGGWTAFVGSTLAAPPGRIAEMMAPRDWPANAWTSCPLLVAVVGLDFSFACISHCLEGLDFRITGDLHWPAPIGGRAMGSRGSLASTYFRGLGPNSGHPAKAPRLPTSVYSPEGII